VSARRLRVFAGTYRDSLLLLSATRAALTNRMAVTLPHELRA